MILPFLEHADPEKIFVTPDNSGEAVSAAKALAKANAENQRIYHITPENQGTTLSNINHDAQTMAEIEAALQVGNEVVTHTDPINIPGWSGAGYIILDPLTGDGAYKISGGMNGGYCSGFSLGSSIAALIVGIVGSSAALSVMTAALLADLLIMAFAFLMTALIMAKMLYELWGAIGGEEGQQCFIGGLVAGFSLWIGLAKITSFLARLFHTLGFAASQTDIVGRSARSCVVI